MIKRTIDISSAPARMRIEHDQLVIEREGMDDARVVCEDLGILLVDQQRTVYTHSVLTRLMEKGACVVLCGEDHLPCGLVLPLEGNELLTQRLRKQVEVGGQKGPLMVQLHRMAASLWGCYAGERQGLDLPIYGVEGLMKGVGHADG